MSEYIITCPICKKQYKLTPKNPAALAQKKFTCPTCHYSTPMTNLIKGLVAPPPQPVTLTDNTGAIPPPVVQQNHSATKVFKTGVQSRVFLTVVGSNSKFILNPGFYILGRKSSDSSATLQVAPDISVSRQHARLTVQFVGGKLMAQVVGLKANNPIFVNGKIYAAGRPCTLNAGDVLQLGMTKLVFSI